jgi:acyl transferase domain-containing protein/NADPH:quinone reductase-like Zn-dependent oxidoreductase/thioesterase domain-containing protein/SAM-dependent methyltransferase/acyl carrier protein
MSSVLNPAAALPVAIIGIGCRLPGGVTDPASFWRLLSEGRQAVGDVPPDRWSLATYFHPDRAAVGAMASRWGGFIDTLDRFDAAFWGLSPREAMRMDPQQRWLLEVTWEAIEDAGIVPSSLHGSATGVFVGISGNDYGGLQLSEADGVDAYTNSGNTASIAANRISYLLDLCGPSVAVDTACSSSLVAVSLACDSLRAGTCETALAGGVNALISPQVSVGFSKASMLSPTGRCHAFDARADGYVRAEGAGVVLLKPLGRALADGDRIYAVIRGTAVNQDGHTSSMTVPSVDGQAAMLRAAYGQAAVAPSAVAYVEAHGTGTPVGDPIEATALGRILGHGRAAGEACIIGSVKTNIGHLESASGIAGLIKAALVAHHGEIPPSLNFEQPNPHIAFDALRLAVAREAQPLVSRDGDAAIVGVNSFGFGGTNAHVVLQAPPPVEPAAEPARAARPLLLPISARDERALRAYVQGYRDRLRQDANDTANLCAAAGARKEHHAHRLVIAGASRAELLDRMRLWLRDGQAPGTWSGRAGAARAPVFVFTGQGAQWWAMGRQLIAREPLVRRRLDDIDALLAPQTGWSLVDELAKHEDASRIDGTDVAQPALFALQVALADLWRSWGVQPAAVIGHSVGEVAAACCAGVYSLDEAVRIIFHRSRLQHTTHGQGRMLAAALSRERAAAVIAGVEGVELAAVNGPQLVTLSGDARGLETIEQALVRDGVFARWVRIAYAFHSAQMDPLRAELIEVLTGLQPRAASVPFVSTVTGAERAGESLDASYWWDNVRDPVLFADGIAALLRAGHDTFLEIGPHPALESAIADCLAAAGAPGAVFHSLRRDADDSDELIATLADMHLHGVPLDWRAVNQGSDARLSLPAYPWTRERFWHESPRSARRRLASPDHPLLGRRIDSPTPSWELSLDLTRLPYLADHRIWDRVVFPGAGFVEMALAAAAQLYPAEPHAVERLEIKSPLFLSTDAAVTVRLAISPDDKTVTVHGTTDPAGPWELHATCALIAASATDGHGPAAVAAIARLRESGTHYSHEQYCERWARRGYQFGPNFQLVAHLWRGHRETVLELAVPPAIAAEQSRYVFHPAVLDGCFHAILGLRATDDAESDSHLYLPESIGRIVVHQTNAVAKGLRVWARLLSDDGKALLADVHARDLDGRAVADIFGFQVVRVEQKGTSLDQCLYRFEWEPRHLPGSGAREACHLAATSDIAEAVSAAAADIESRFALSRYSAGGAWRREAVAHLVLNAFAALGWRLRRGDRFTADELIARLGVVAEHHRAVRVLVADLEAAGWLTAEPDGSWTMARDADVVDGAALIDRLVAAHPEAAPDLGLLRLTGLDLAAVLAGEVDATRLMFPNGSTDAVERFYREGTGFPGHLDALRIALARAVADRPAARTIRVLEVGAGTGTATAIARTALPALHTEYWYTDVSNAFLSAAQHRFAASSGMTYRLFDIERPPRAQGIPEQYFDLVIASNVLHATASLRETLAHVRRCLAPGGLLIFLELVTRRHPIGNVTFGLLRGWWRTADRELRPHSPVLDRAQWVSLLAESGFRQPRTVAGSIDEQDMEHAIVMAAAPAEPAVDAVEATAPKRYLLIADRTGFAATLAVRLQQDGHECDLIHADADASEAALQRALTDVERTINGVIHCRSLDAPAAGVMTVDALRSLQQHSLMSAFRLIRAIASQSTPVWFITRDAYGVAQGDGVSGLAAAPLVGMARVANNEHECRFFVVDLDAAGDADQQAELIAAEITLPSDREFEIAYRSGIRHAPRLRRVRPDAFARRSVEAIRPDGSPTAFRLETTKPGVLTNLSWHATRRVDPGPGEIEVQVGAGGLNFRDVLKALGTHPGHPPDLEWFGDDFAGTVVRVGDGVDQWQPGDVVAGIAPRAFGAFARTDARFAFRVPDRMSCADAATVPTAFLTALQGLVRLAHLQPGERLLIHAGAGGVGLAAIQIAQRLSLEIFATAGTPEKRELLRSLGVPHVFNSRTLAFADEILDQTGGRGVDAVLNSLAGEFIPRSLAVLAPFGRFIEIGKADIYRNARLGLQALRQNISYFAVDLTQFLTHRPDLIEQMFSDIADGFATGDYRPLPSTAFGLDDVVAAFRHMAQGKHVGKNVLTFEPAPRRIGCATDPRERFSADASYLVVGGAGGIGLRVAEWIAASGARHVALMSRSGPDQESQRRIDRLRERGVTVLDARGDVASAADVTRVVAEIEAAGAPLKGVFHAATVMDDEFLARQDPARFARVLEPKMAGAWNLHLATRDLPLDHFVCFSSCSTVIALPKQASYNAGNLFLDHLAHYRHALGLPALTINFGAVLGAGFVERQRRDGEALAKLGFGAFDIDETLQVLETLTSLEAVHVSAARIDWQPVQRLSPLVATAAAYRPMVEAARDGAPRGSLSARLSEAPDEQRARLMQDFVASQVAAVFGVAEDRIDRQTPLNTLGLDSLMVLELTNRVERELGLRIPMADLLSGPTVVALSDTVLRLLAPTLARGDRDPRMVAAGTAEATAAPSGEIAEALQTDAAPAASSDTHIVVLRARTGGAPMFAFHQAGGGVGVYAGLAPHLPEAVALYGVESRLKRGAAREYDTLDDMVAHYAAAVRRTTDGPLRLFGFSLGGYLAARVAATMEADGAEVDGVGVIDWDVRPATTADASRDRLLRMAVAAYQFAQETVGLVRPLAEPALTAEIRSVVDAIFAGNDEGGELFYHWVASRGLIVSPALADVARHQLTCFEQHCHLLRQPLPLPPLHAPLCVWRARDGFGSGLASWRDAGPLDRCYIIDGDHNAWTRPAALATIGRQMSAFFAEAAAARDRDPVGPGRSA